MNSSVNSKMSNIDWSDLPEELVDVIADRLSSNIDLLRIRSICKPWRYAVAMKKRFQNRFDQGNISSLSKKKKTRLFPTTLFRVTLPSSCSSKGWLIRTRQVSESSKNNLLSPFSRQLITYSNKTLDLLKFAVSEISQSYEIQYLKAENILSSRVVFIDDMFFALDEYNKIRCFKSGEECNWTTIKNQVDDFSDIIVHRGHIYALDKNGAICWISLSQLSTGQYSPSTPLDYYEIDSCKEKRLVEYCGDLCIVHRFCKNFQVKGAYIKRTIERTIGFKVYKMDGDLAQWVKVSSLGDKALIVAVDRCFMVVASEYYGCLANSIYFTDNDGDKFSKGLKVEDVQPFKLEDGSIISMNDSSNSQSCFHIFSLFFLSKD